MASLYRYATSPSVAGNTAVGVHRRRTVNVCARCHKRKRKVRPFVMMLPVVANVCSAIANFLHVLVAVKLGLNAPD